MKVIQRVSLSFSEDNHAHAPVKGLNEFLSLDGDAKNVSAYVLVDPDDDEVSRLTVTEVKLGQIAGSGEYQMVAIDKPRVPRHFFVDIDWGVKNV